MNVRPQNMGLTWHSKVRFTLQLLPQSATVLSNGMPKTLRTNWRNSLCSSALRESSSHIGERAQITVVSRRVCWRFGCKDDNLVRVSARPPIKYDCNPVRRQHFYLFSACIWDCVCNASECPVTCCCNKNDVKWHFFWQTKRVGYKE